MAWVQSRFRQQNARTARTATIQRQKTAAYRSASVAESVEPQSAPKADVVSISCPPEQHRADTALLTRTQKD